ncbi:MAG: exodeoxyribonuclease VII small subunit [Paraglaciecola sp.]|jgi:exodeoxyribonuclease VII small subunit
MTNRKKAENLTFEESMQELESIVKQMEQGELPLEDALQRFERGIQLARHSQQKLKQAEQKVQILMNQNGQTSLQPLDQSEPAE